MAKIESRLITKKMPWHANMTEMNHLGAALIAKPHVMEGVMTKLFTSQQYSDNALTSMLVKEGRTKTIDKSSWEWQLRGASTRPLVVVENMQPDSNTTIGKFKVDFDMKYDENWWKPGDVIHPGTSDKRNQCRVVTPPQRHGKGWIYKLRIMTDDPSFFINSKYFSTGTLWSKLYSVYEEGAEQAGSTQYSSNLSLENELGRFRKSYMVTGDVANEALAVMIPTSDGQMVKSWIKYAEVEYWQQWYKELDIANIYSRKVNSVLGGNGRPVNTFPGIHEQLEDSHVHHFSVLSARLIEEYLMDIFYGRVKPGAQRHVKGLTGEYGMLNFHRAIERIDAKRGFLQVVDDKFVQSVSSPYHTNALSYGYQYTMYKMANGSSLELVHLPLYDDREINMEIDPVTGYPTESQRITFLDFGDKNNSNISLINKKDEFKVGYVAGTQNPYGPAKNNLMAHTGDYYELLVQDRKGVHIEDVTRCGELILSRN